MRWSVRKNAADRPTVETLTKERAATAAEIRALVEEKREIEAALPELQELDPARAADADDRLAALATEEANRRRRLAYIEASIGKLEAEELNRAGDAEHTAMMKRQGTSAKRIRAFDKLLPPLLAELEWMESEVQVFAEYNARRGQRPFVEDPEALVRKVPGRIVPARFEDREIWSDGAGRQPCVFRHDDQGQPVPVEGGYTKKIERVCVSPEREILATMPERLAELLPALRKASA
jgi:hypothetical protein